MFNTWRPPRYARLGHAEPEYHGGRVVLPMPRLLQLGLGNCGAVSALAVLSFLRPGSDPDALEKDVPDGATADELADALARHGVVAEVGCGKLTVADVAGHLRHGHPPLVGVRGLFGGHWLVAAGADTGDGYVRVVDPGLLSWLGSPWWTAASWRSRQDGTYLVCRRA